MLGDLTAEDAEVEAIKAEQREYAALGWIGRWHWRRENWGAPVGWRSMTWSARRKCRREGLTQ